MSLEKFKQIFGEFAESAEFLDENIKKLNLEKDSKILDIGAGIGAMSTLLALNGFDVLTGEPALDIDKGNRDDDHKQMFVESQAQHDYQHHENHEYKIWGDWKESAKSLGVFSKIKYQYLDAQDLSFEDDSFDGIFLYDSLQHIQNKELALKECIRVLKPRGIIFVMEWTKKQIEEDYKKYGYKIDLINPEDYLKGSNIKIELISGNKVNIFVLLKN